MTIHIEPAPALEPRARSWGWAAFSLFAAMLGVSYLPFARPESLPFGLNLMTGLMPIWGWGIAWIISGTVGVWAGVTGRGMPLALGLLTFCHIIWSGAYLAGFLVDLAHGNPSRAWVNFRTYAAPLGLIWAVWIAHRPPRIRRTEK